MGRVGSQRDRFPRARGRRPGKQAAWLEIKNAESADLGDALLGTSRGAVQY